MIGSFPSPHRHGPTHKKDPFRQCRGNFRSLRHGQDHGTLPRAETTENGTAAHRARAAGSARGRRARELPRRDARAAGRGGGEVCVPAWDAAAGRYALAALPADAAVAPGFGGIPEPVGTRRVDPATVDLFVLPGLLFDRTGTRLGHGRGHLDRLLAARRPGAAVLGLAFPWQIADAPIPREAHDVPMDAVLIP